MKKLNLKKIIVMGLITTSILGVTSVGASAEWKKDSYGWWYSKGSSYSTGWDNIGGKWYYFDGSGYMKTGWFHDNNGSWYYFNIDGSMVTTTDIIGSDMVLFGSDGVWLGYAKSSTTDTPDTSYTFDMAKAIVNKNVGFPIGECMEYDVTQGGYNGRPKEDKVYTLEIGGKYYSYRIVGAIDKHTGEYVGSAYVFESGYIMDMGSNVLLGTQTKFDETTFDISNVLQTINTQTTTATKTQEQQDQEEMDRMMNLQYRNGHMDEYNRLMAKYGNK
ncbi:cell wall-binding protein [Clostridium sp.]|uniref:cell wall-binding protein n=1 Tax=Clostridium sp. TaxID=1506 RepID=UPI002843A4AE|nr:cell wall-binding protein [Clostridium sp.]MDR3596443.1 cell wall-binding protein [Clostridium sp.]